MIIVAFVLLLLVILGLAGVIVANMFVPDDSLFDGFGDDADFDEDDRFFLTDKGWDE